MVSAALLFESIFAAVDVILGPLLHLLNIMARVVDVLLTECADHKLDLRLRCWLQVQRGGQIAVPLGKT
jgi:hypothetical protein